MVGFKLETFGTLVPTSWDEGIWGVSIFRIFSGRSTRASWQKACRNHCERSLKNKGWWFQSSISGWGWVNHQQKWIAHQTIMLIYVYITLYYIYIIYIYTCIIYIYINIMYDIHPLEISCHRVRRLPMKPRRDFRCTRSSLAFWWRIKALGLFVQRWIPWPSRCHESLGLQININLWPSIFGTWPSIFQRC